MEMAMEKIVARDTSPPLGFQIAAGPVPNLICATRDDLDCVGMTSLLAILVCDGDPGFREALRNFLLAAGYSKVDVVPTVREALAKLRHENYGCILFGIARSHGAARRLATVTQRRQPGARVLFLVSAEDAPVVNDTSLAYIIRERVFSTLLDSLPRKLKRVCYGSEEAQNT